MTRTGPRSSRPWRHPWKSRNKQKTLWRWTKDQSVSPRLTSSTDCSRPRSTGCHRQTFCCLHQAGGRSYISERKVKGSRDMLLSSSSPQNCLVLITQCRKYLCTSTNHVSTELHETFSLSRLYRSSPMFVFVFVFASLLRIQLRFSFSVTRSPTEWLIDPWHCGNQRICTRHFFAEL